MKPQIATTISLFVLATAPSYADSELALAAAKRQRPQFKLHVDQSSEKPLYFGAPELLAPDIITHRPARVSAEMVRQLGLAKAQFSESIYGKHLIVPGHTP